jgi:hypothetical protein
VRFNAGGDDRLRRISDIVAVTTIEAVTDADGRPYALWLRTPEPVDWRRVTLSLTIRHVEPATGCPTKYAHRTPLHPTLSVLPSPDGISAFLISVYAGSAMRLPRGEYTLTLRFDPAKAGLPPLRPSVFVGTGSELVTLRFLQPFGKPWPMPSDSVAIPNLYLEVALKHLKFDPEIFVDAYQNNWSAEELERRIQESIRPRIVNPAFRLASGVPGALGSEEEKS